MPDEKFLKRHEAQLMVGYDKDLWVDGKAVKVMLLPSPHSKPCFLSHFSSRLKSVRGRVQEIKIIDYSDVSIDDSIEPE